MYLLCVNSLSKAHIAISNFSKWTKFDVFDLEAWTVSFKFSTFTFRKNLSFSSQTIKFNLTDKFDHWKCRWLLKCAFLIPKLMLWTLRLEGHVEMLVIFNIFKLHHIRANVNVEPCEEWEGGVCVVCMHIHYTFDKKDTKSSTDLSVWIDYCFSGSHTEIES